MNREGRNFPRSSDVGEKAEALDLACSSCSFPDAFVSCSLWKHMPGLRRGVPNTISATEVAVSVLGALRRPSRTQGRDRVHDRLERTAQRRAFLRVWWNRSTTPFACGW